MRQSAIRFGVVLVSVGVLVPSLAMAQALPPNAQPVASPTQQLPPNAGGAQMDPDDQLRTQIAFMEGALERAVGDGIRSTMAQMPDVISGPWMFGGSGRVRGFNIDGYGLFFDVEVPSLPASIAWSLQVLSRNNDAQMRQEIAELRAMVNKVSDEPTRTQIQRRIDRLATLSGTMPLVTPPGGNAQRSPQQMISVDGPVVARPAAAPIAPDKVYTKEVMSALVRALLDQAAMFRLGPNDRFTIAARDSQSSSPMVGLAAPEVSTLYLTISGSDLEALRTGKITREEAAKRVKTNQF